MRTFPPGRRTSPFNEMLRACGCSGWRVGSNNKGPLILSPSLDNPNPAFRRPTMFARGLSINTICIPLPEDTRKPKWDDPWPPCYPHCPRAGFDCTDFIAHLEPSLPAGCSLRCHTGAGPRMLPESRPTRSITGTLWEEKITTRSLARSHYFPPSSLPSRSPVCHSRWVAVHFPPKPPIRGRSSSAMCCPSTKPTTKPSPILTID